jgi:hypothetical protein
MSELSVPPTDDDLDGDGEPDDGYKPPGAVGRLVEPDLGSLPDEEAELIATETDDGLGLSAEEAALHIVDEP